MSGTTRAIACLIAMRYLLACAAIVTATGRAAHADEWSDDPRPPAAVRVRLDGTTAVVSARYTFVVPGPELAALPLELPSHAVISDATATIAGVRHHLPLVRASEADAALQHLQDNGPDHGRAFAVAISGAPFGMTATVQIAVPRRAAVAIDLELGMATCFHADARYLVLPAAWAARVDPHLHRGPPGDDCGASEHDGEQSAWIGFAVGDLAARPAGDGRIGTIAGRLALDDLDIARVELDLSRQISAVPDDLATVLVIDASRSLDPAQVAAQRALVASYLAKAPRSRVQVVAYARTAKPLLPDWTPAAQAAPRIDRELGALLARNGSDIDAGLAEAARWLALTAGTRRVVLFSDELLAQRLVDAVPAARARIVPAGTLVHVVALDAGEQALARDDEGLLAPLAAATEGIAVRGGLPETGADATMLVRPIAIDHLTLDAPGWDTASEVETTCPFGAETALAEGSSCTWWGKGAAESGPVTIEGRVWGRRFVRAIAPDPSRARTIARELTAFAAFDEDVEQEIDAAAYVVDSVWSLFATWGGTGGYADTELAMNAVGGFSTCGGDTGTTGGGGYADAHPVVLDLRDQLAPVIAACRADDHRIAITIETTRDEIVAVAVAADAPDVRDCVEEGVWDVPLALATPVAHATSRVTFEP